MITNPSQEPYRVVIADPPWGYKHTPRNGGAANHYPTMDVADICRLHVTNGPGKLEHISKVAAKNSILLLWCPWTHLVEGLEVMKAWGFEYRSGMPWVKLQNEPFVDLFDEQIIKPQYGTGWWFRGCSEPLLLGVCGKPPVKLKTNALGLLSENFGHSRKPDNLYQYAEQFTGPYLELFARRKREGWSQHGNEMDAPPVNPAVALRGYLNQVYGPNFVTDRPDLDTWLDEGATYCDQYVNMQGENEEHETDG